MAAPIIKIKRGTTAPVATLNAGEFAIDQVAKNLYLGVEVGGVVTNEIVGGEGTFATKAYVATALGGVSGTLGTMATQNANNVAITGGTVDGTVIGATAASTGKFTQLDVGVDITMSGSGVIDMNAGRIINLTAPLNNNDAVRKTDLDTAIGALGSVFSYKGQLTSVFVPGNPLSFPLDLSALSQDTGSYYSLNYDYSGAGNPNTGAVEVTWTEGGVPKTFLLKIGDAIIKTTSGWEKIDNVDAVVSGTANEIAVTGDENVGYTVSIDPVFSGRVTTAETDITDLEAKTQNITAIAGETDVAGILTSQELWVGPNSTDAVKLLNAGGGTQAILEMPVGKEFVIKTDSGANAIKVGSGNGRVDFAYDVDVATVMNAAVYSGGSANFNSLSINTSANFNGGINLNTGNLVGNGTNEITDFVIDGGSY